MRREGCEEACMHVSSHQAFFLVVVIVVVHWLISKYTLESNQTNYEIRKIHQTGRRTKQRFTNNENETRKNNPWLHLGRVRISRGVRGQFPQLLGGHIGRGGHVQRVEGLFLSVVARGRQGDASGGLCIEEGADRRRGGEWMRMEYHFPGFRGTSRDVNLCFET